MDQDEGVQVMTIACKINRTGWIEWRNKNGKLHRGGDLPAVITSQGSQFWFHEGIRHRDNDLPASVCSNGSLYWWKDGDVHRDGDLPAVIYFDGTKLWFLNGTQYTPRNER